MYEYVQGVDLEVLQILNPLLSPFPLHGCQQFFLPTRSTDFSFDMVSAAKSADCWIGAYKEK